MTTAVYPGSFDPITNGHLDVIARASAVFDRVVVAVLANPRKQPLLDADERVAVIRASLAAAAPTFAIAPERVAVPAFERLTDGLCGRRGDAFIVRGLRAISDFETEMLLAHNNRRLAPAIDTVFFMTSIEHSYVASSLVKEIATFGGDVSAMIPPAALDALRRAIPAA